MGRPLHARRLRLETTSPLGEPCRVRRALQHRGVSCRRPIPIEVPRVCGWAVVGQVEHLAHISIVGLRGLGFWVRHRESWFLWQIAALLWNHWDPKVGALVGIWILQGFWHLDFDHLWFVNFRRRALVLDILRVLIVPVDRDSG